MPFIKCTHQLISFNTSRPNTPCSKQSPPITQDTVPRRAQQLRDHQFRAFWRRQQTCHPAPAQCRSQNISGAAHGLPLGPLDIPARAVQRLARSRSHVLEHPTRSELINRCAPRPSTTADAQRPGPPHSLPTPSRPLFFPSSCSLDVLWRPQHHRRLPTPRCHPVGGHRTERRVSRPPSRHQALPLQVVQHMARYNSISRSRRGADGR